MSAISWLGALRASLLCGSLLLGACVNTGDLNVSPFRSPDELTEEVIYGKDNPGPKLALVEVTGVISEDAPIDPFVRPPVNMVTRIREALDLAREDDEVKGVLLRVFSPGGTVTASETIHHELARFRKETGLPIVTYMQGLAASGGYYVSMASDEIVAHPATVTGSIGVISPSINLSGLMERFGVKDQTLTTGAFKDSGSPFRPMRDDEREYMKKLLDDLFAGFREVVIQGRPKLTTEQIDALADGRVFTAKQAKEVGLIDQIGHFEDAVAALEARAGVKQARVVLYQRPDSYRTNEFSRVPLQAPRVDVDVDWTGLRDLIPPAGFYYIWPQALLELTRTPHAR
jgi:protease IV